MQSAVIIWRWLHAEFQSILLARMKQRFSEKAFALPVIIGHYGLAVTSEVPSSAPLKGLIHQLDYISRFSHIRSSIFGSIEERNIVRYMGVGILHYPELRLRLH